MRLPAVAMAVAIAGGILLGLHPAVAQNATSFFCLLSSSFMTIAVLVLTGIISARIGRLFVSTIVSLLSWVLLGFLGVYNAEQPREANYVISIVEQRRLPLKMHLRCHGHPRDEPTRLPWGTGYEIELSGAGIPRCSAVAGWNHTRRRGQSLPTSQPGGARTIGECECEDLENG